ncbi:MAG: hypothetical protein ACREMB_27995 [Candidatus Rokuibacteriota bacterium]
MRVERSRIVLLAGGFAAAVSWVVGLRPLARAATAPVVTVYKTPT